MCVKEAVVLTSRIDCTQVNGGTDLDDRSHKNCSNKWEHGFFYSFLLVLIEPICRVLI